MIVHLKTRQLEREDESRAIRYAVMDLIYDGTVVSGGCGITVRMDQLQEFVDRIDPDYFNDRQYIPGMPIDLEHSRNVES